MAEFKNAATASVKMKVNADAEGNIALAGDAVKGSKTPTIQGVKADATLAEATAVFDAFYGEICGATFDSLSAEKTIKQGVVE